jgi:polar amino acid transport system substrate-binding protein
MFRDHYELTAATVALITILCAASPAKADLESDIKKKGEITVATEARFQPLEFVEAGKIVGYGPELMQLVMQKMPGVKLNQLDLPWQGILPGLTAKKWDFVITSVTMTRERMGKFAFTSPVAEATVALVKRKADTSISKPEDIAGKVVGSHAGSAQLQVLKDYNAQLIKNNQKGVVEIKEYVDFNEAYSDLAAGRIQAVAHALVNLAQLIKERGDVYALVPTTIGPKTYFAWAGRNDPESASLVKFFSDELISLKKSGKMKELQLKWIGVEMDLPDVVTDPGM